ncbi:MAG: hypothetical protein KDA95_10635 [Acidimicrobiales bacterium]|nr:hypothetical protein [Acidimicrobiales bacterium]
MGQIASIYGLDIETDTSCDGLDPSIASIKAIALSGQNFDLLFDGDEHNLLVSLDDHLSGLAPGVIATWNGGTFDLPFIADRAELLGINLGLRLRSDRSRSLRRSPLPGHGGAYQAGWHDHGHLDTYCLYGHPAIHPRRSLRSLGRFVGLGDNAAPLACDLGNEALHACAPSDARLARVLAERRWQSASRMLDRVPHDEAETVRVAANRATRRDSYEMVTVSTIAATT